MFEQIPEWLQIFLLSMIPGIESRFIIPFAVHEFGWVWWHAFPVAVAGNMFLVPFILKFLHLAEKYLRRFPRWKKTMDWGFPKIRRRADKKIQKYETYALLLFVAIPIPLTGAGLGSLIAYLFDLPFYRSLLMIFVGVIVSAIVMTFAYFYLKIYLGVF